MAGLPAVHVGSFDDGAAVIPYTHHDAVALTGSYREIADAELVRRFQEGDTDAFTALYARHQPSVRRLCAARLRRADLVDDAVQETFARVLAKLPEFDGGARVLRYALRVAKYICLDRVAAADAATDPLEREDAEDIADTVDLEHVCERRLTARTVLAGVSAHQAWLLTAHHAHDRPIADLAAQAGTTSGSVAVLLHRARSAARAVAADRGIRGLLPLPLLARLDSLIERVQRLPPATVANSVASAAAVVLAGGVLAVTVGVPNADATAGTATPPAVETVLPDAQAPAATTGTVAPPAVEAALPEVALPEVALPEVALPDAPTPDAAQPKPPAASLPVTPDVGVSPVEPSTPSSTTIIDPDTTPSPAARQPEVPLPEVALPSGERGIHQQPAEQPEHAYGIAVEAEAVEVRLGIEVDEEPEQEPVHRAACVAAAATPVTYCATQ